MIYTLIAEMPADAQPPYAASDADIASLETIRTNLETAATANATTQFLCGVSSLSDVVIFLKAHIVKPGDEVRFVGHARSGRLELGAFWTGRDTEHGTAWVLTADVARNVALAGHIDPGATVTLIGCDVGQDHIDGEADGPSLLFCLAREWDCVVRGTVDSVTDQSFDSNGLLLPATRTVEAKNRTVSGPLSPQAIPSVHGPSRLLPPAAKFIQLKLLGPGQPSPERTAFVLAGWKLAFSGLKLLPCAEPLYPLGLPEIVVDLGGGQTATFSSGAALVHFSDDPPAKYYTPENYLVFHAELKKILDGSNVLFRPSRSP